MKKYFAAVCLVLVVCVAFVGCTDSLYKSEWKMQVVKDGSGDVIACSDDMGFDDSVPRANVICDITEDDEIILTNVDAQKKIKGKMTMLSTELDGTVNYSVTFDNGKSGKVEYNKDANEGEYGLVVSISDEFTMYFSKS